MDSTISDTVQTDIFMVGIAASAGGLEAASLLAQNLPKEAKASYVLAQHMSPTHKSLLSSLISRETKLPVVDLEDEAEPQVNTIYITPPNSDVIYEGGKLRLVRPAGHAATPKPSADRLFTSLSEACGEMCVGIVLSGTGSDGSYGVQAIREVGGITIAQDVSSAKYDGMPASAIETGCVDLTLTPEQIGQHLEKILARPRDFDQLRRLNERPSKISDLLQILLARTNVDFRDYKENTITRRINRRMAALGIDDYDRYVGHCRTSAEEVEALYRDLLISVTRFFRDPLHFTQLLPQFTKMVRSKDFTQVRVWVAGCATGEEAYSIAILLAEAFGGIENLSKSRVQIFATDIDDRALQIARAGTYPITAANDIPPEYLSKYFRIMESKIEVIQPLKSITLFSQHNLIQDPPFLNLDFVSLRNVLIYFNAHLQERVLSRIHYSLTNTGMLFLGTSETVGALETMFEQKTGADKLFMKRQVARHRAVAIEKSLAAGNITIPTRTRDLAAVPPGVKTDVKMFDSLARAVAPNGFVVTRNSEVVRVFGNISQFIELDEDAPLWLSVRSLRKPLRDEMTGLIATSLKNAARRNGRWHDVDGNDFNKMRAVCFPILNSGDGEDHVLVALETRLDEAQVRTFEDLSDTDQKSYLRQMELEVSSTREALQQSVEELQTTNEELQAVNEELQSSNEELQATNEELETSNEELQSTNEELITVNEELQVNSSELQRVWSQMSAVLDFVPMPMLVVDHALIIRHASREAKAWFGIGELPPTGLHLSQVELPEGLPALPAVCNSVFTLRESQRFKVEAKRAIRDVIVAPFCSETGESLGVVVSVVEDVNTTADTIDLLQTFGGIGHWQLELDTNSLMWSNEVFRIHGLPIGSPVPNVTEAIEFYHPDDRQRVTEQIEACIEKGTPFHFLLRLVRADGRTIVVESSGRRVTDYDGKPTRLIGVFRNVTETTHQNLVLKQMERVQENIGIGFYSYDIANELPYWSEGLHSMLGYDPHTHIPTVQSGLEIIHPDDRDRVAEYLKEATEDGTSFDYEARLLKSGGEVLRCRGKGQALIGEAGKPTHVFGSFRIID